MWRAFEAAGPAAAQATDECALVERLGLPVMLVPGDEGILSIETTLPEPHTDPYDNATARVFKAVAGDQIPSPGVRFLHDAPGKSPKGDDVLLKAVKAFTQWHRGRH